MRQSNTNISLPPLVFGGRTAKITDSSSEALSQIRLVAGGIQLCESASDKSAFEHQSSFISIDGMNMLAYANTPARTEFSHNTYTTLLIPFIGQGHLMIDGRVINWQSGVNAVLLPRCASIGEASMHSVLMIDIDPLKLAVVTKSMLSLNESQNYQINLDGPKKLGLQVGRISFDVVFRQIASLIDHLSLQPALLKQSGIDNLIYRNLAIMLQPELFLKATNAALKPEYARRLLDRVCNYIKAHISQNITIATLERVSNMSARNLHYAFLKRYNTTPMKWVRRERLMLAQTQLLSAIPGSTVTSIALSCGFSKPSAFSNYYFEAFGELPSLTLSKALKR